MNLIVFDSDCLLCSRAIQFVLKHDKHKYFRFISLSNWKKIEGNLPTDLVVDSIIYIENQQKYYYADAVLKILLKLNWLTKLLANVMYIFPRIVRNTVYKFIAKNRYRWFGKMENCLIISKSDKTRFLT